jgi:magnesium chelatase family protein
MPEENMETYCLVEAAARKFLLGKMDRLQLSVRAYSRILKVSRTIADLAGSNTVEIEHVAEATTNDPPSSAGGFCIQERRELARRSG